MFFFLSKILDLAFSPLAWAIGLCIAAGFSRTHQRARLLTVLAATLLFAFSVEPVSNRLMQMTEQGATKTMRPGVTYDVVVLLGGLVDHRATATAHVPSYNDGVERLISTYELLRTGRARTALLSGGRDEDADPVVEGATLATQLEEWGIAKDRLLVEGASRNTRENAAFSAKLIRDRRFTSVLLVTSAAHVPRALDAFRAEGIEADALPVDYRAYDATTVTAHWLPRAACLATSTAALRELAGRLVYRVVGFGRG